MVLLLALSTPGHVAQAQLVLDPASVKPMPAALATPSNVLPGTATADGFSALVFRPGADQSTLPLAAVRMAPAASSASAALKMHLHNPMAWPLTVLVTLDDTHGARLQTTLALPPGPAVTAVIPLEPTQPLAWGMRAAPPQPVLLDNERLLIATAVRGRVDSTALARLTLRVPDPDSEQTLRLGKVFLDRERDDERRLYAGIVDCFGQYTRGQWTGKHPGPCAAANADRRAGRATQSAGANAATPEPIASATSRPARDPYGGIMLADWPAAELATGYFRTYQGAADANGRPGRWMLLSPKGYPFFSLGVNAIQIGNSASFIEGREFMFTDLPAADSPLSRFYGRLDDMTKSDAGAQRGRGYGKGRTYDFYQANLWREFGPDFAKPWAAQTEARLQRWGFNTLGAWSDEALIAQTTLPYTLIVHIEGDFQRLSDGVDWWGGIADPFDPAFGAAIHQQLVPVVARHRNNRALIGYFVDNELGWGDGSASAPANRWAVVYSALAMDARAPQAHAKRAFLDWLQQQYASPQALARAWQIEITSWRQLEAPLTTAQLAPHTTPALARDLLALSRLFAERYFSQIHDTLKALDPHHLYLGARFASRTPEAVAACVRYCDVVSFNLYVPDIARGFEATSFAQHNKPAMLTEFHFGSADAGPFWPGVMAVAREQDRAPAYRHMLDSVLANPQFVGAHWFQYLDQAVTGRWLDGENGHLGLVDIVNQPWGEFTAGVQAANSAILQRLESAWQPR